MTADAETLALAAQESARFGLRVARATLSDQVDAGAIVDWLATNRVDIAILRVPADAGAVGEAFRRVGLDPLHADSLVTWECDLQRHAPPPIPVDAPLTRSAQAADAPSIIDLVHQVFGRYRNHYNANPLIDGAGAIDGYGEWALDHIDRPDRLCWITSHDEKVSGLACSSHDSSTGICVGNLHGVAPAWSGRGIYTELIRATQRHYRAAGFRHLRISTQLGNLTVQRVWAREGFVFAKAEHTYHLSPLFGCAFEGRGIAAAIGHRAPPLEALWQVHRAAIGADGADGVAGPTHAHLRADAVTTHATRYVHGERASKCGRRHVSLALGDADQILGWAQTDR